MSHLSQIHYMPMIYHHILLFKKMYVRVRVCVCVCVYTYIQPFTILFNMYLNLETRLSVTLL
jgi:hypothetical protein